MNRNREDDRVWSTSHQPACPVPEHLDDTPEDCLFDEETPYA